MALRIGGPKKEQTKAPEATATEPGLEELLAGFEAPDASAMPEETPMDEDMEQESGGILDKGTAGYLGPEDGPFKCANCIYFSPAAPNTCAIVEGMIDPEGCCNLYTKADGGEEEMPTEEMGAPAEEVAPVPEAEEAPEEGY